MTPGEVTRPASSFVFRKYGDVTTRMSTSAVRTCAVAAALASRYHQQAEIADSLIVDLGILPIFDTENGMVL